MVQEAWRQAFTPLKEGPKDTQVPTSTTLTPLDTTPITWQYPKEGICVLDLFGGISTSLAAILQAGICVQRYVYVERDETIRQVSLHHIGLLSQRYPHLLSLSAVRGCQRMLPSDISLVGVQDLARVGSIDLVIMGWPCQGHLSARQGRGFDDPQSTMFWEMLQVL